MCRETLSAIVLGQYGFRIVPAVNTLAEISASV